MDWLLFLWALGDHLIFLSDIPQLLSLECQSIQFFIPGGRDMEKETASFGRSEDISLIPSILAAANFL